ncbi:MAG: HAMP domain-containing histidine kinase [Candidatus Aureabacteria bacterium]|nr:HAMP domain-containing histidine kinase [Candidatus Auribacterota bacterium]
MQYRKTLSLKINLLILSITSLSVLLTTVLYIHKQKIIFLSALEKNGVTLCRNLAVDSQYGVWADDRNDLQNYLKGIMTDQDVFLVFIENNKGDILASSGRFQEETDMAPIVGLCQEGRHPSEKGGLFLYENRKFLYFKSKIQIQNKTAVYTPLYEEPSLQEESRDLGYANVLFSLDGMEKELARSKKDALILSVVLFLIFSILGTYFSNGIVQPVLMLVKATRKISSGNLDVELPPKTANEIGLLSDSFHQMILHIREKNVLKEQVLAVEKIASIGKLAGGLAHEFNNILSAISMDVEASLEMNDGRYSRESMQNIMDAVQSGMAITKNLLNYARPSPPAFASANIHDVLMKSVSLIRQELMHFGIRISVSGNTDLFCNMDAQQIQQVFLNILTNARDAMRNSGFLDVSVSKENGYALLLFKDTGTGILDSDMERIFEPFFTTKGDYGKSQVPGTGLGLFISREIIQNHWGTLVIQSRASGGTEVQIRLPLTCL